MNINQVLEAARRVEQARAQLKSAEEDLANLTGAGGRGARPTHARRSPIRGPAGPSISQRVLRIVTDSGRSGIARRDIVAALGAPNEAAIHSALKVHSSKGLIESDGGVWVSTEAALHTPQSQTTDTRPMRAIKDPSPYVGQQ